MFKNENIICISSIDWDFVWQGHQEIMARFAKNGNRVLFIENTGVRRPNIKDIYRIKSRIRNWLKGVRGIRKEMENVYIFSPILLPLPYSRIARWINQRISLSILEKWMKVMDFSDPIIWTFLPTGFALDLINNIDNKLVVYYCIADFEKLVKNPLRIRKTEEGVMRASDIIFAQGSDIKARCLKYNKNVHMFPFGVNTDVFNPGCLSGKKPQDIEGVKRPIIGYVGGIHRHIDFGLVKFLAERNSGWNFVFVGPAQIKEMPLKELPNIIFLGIKKHKDLPDYMDNFDACLIPYEINEYTRTVYPTKMNEYLGMGKPVISTPLPEVIGFNKENQNPVYIGASYEEFESQIKKVISLKDPDAAQRYIEIAVKNSWTARIGRMSEIMVSTIQRKMEERENNWKENFISFYKALRRKALKIMLVLVIGYIVLFKTPFIWFIASPLKIDFPLHKADVIVVFGGGVGETGSPGNSTIERSMYAARLYKEGYANKIIFSSGYTYIYNDAENMKVVAVSLGVADSDIILEKKANSAYENVIFTQNIVRKNGWESIILVSSPYNMRRVYFVYKKHGNYMDVIYAPVKDSQFYDRSGGVKLSQIKAIAHEYGSILYYFLKGRI